MWKAFAIPGLGLFLLVCGYAADFWQTKSPDSWTEKEVAKILHGSPWSKDTVLWKSGTEQTKQTTESPTKTGTKTTTKTVTTKVKVAAGKFLVRWESAAPVLAATLRLDARLRKAFGQLADDYYLLSLNGLEPGTDPGLVVDDLQGGCLLKWGDKGTKPFRVLAMDSGKGPFYLLQFSRDNNLENVTKDVELEIRYQGKVSHVWFEPKHMVFEGKPAL